MTIIRATIVLGEAAAAAAVEAAAEAARYHRSTISIEGSQRSAGLLIQSAVLQGGYNWKKHVLSPEQRAARQRQNAADDAVLLRAVEKHQKDSGTDASQLSSEDRSLIERQRRNTEILRLARDTEPEELELSSAAQGRLREALARLGDGAFVLDEEGFVSGSDDRLLKSGSARSGSAELEHKRMSEDGGLRGERLAAAEEMRSALLRRREDPSEKWRRLREQRERLPAWSERRRVVDAVNAHQVVVISGETGCGKTTQVPQFLLDDAIMQGKGSEISIVCTQPRRISAISVAERVAQERLENVGQSVGYQIRLDRRASDDTRLLFCTTGILLRKLQYDPSLLGVTHVILDEVHERNLESDFLLICLRDLLRVRPELRVVVMSATLNADLFASYFHGGDNSTGLPRDAWLEADADTASERVASVPTVHIPGYTHPVQRYFLEDAIALTGTLPDSRRSRRDGVGERNRVREPETGDQGGREDGESGRREFFQSRMVELKHRFPSIPDDAANALTFGFDDEKPPVNVAVSLVRHIHRNMCEGAILIFMSGWGPIDDMCSKLRQIPEAATLKLYQLHGSMPISQQRGIFERPEDPRVRKVVVSTNIAESSITIEDVVFVVDFGRHKEKTYDAATDTSCLLESWVSKASARQRCGRAGRVQAGFCWHLFPQWKHETLQEYALPEMVRTPLAQCCLRTRALKVASPGPGGVETFLQKAVTPPDTRALAKALIKLRIIGALNATTEELTPLGEALSALPMDPAIAKSLVFSILFGCLDPVLTITSVLSNRNLFVIPSKEHQAAADRAKRRMAGGEASDHFAMLHAFDSFRELRRTRSDREVQRFCFENFLSLSTLRMVADVREQFLRLLQDAGLLSHGEEEGGADASSPWFDRHSSNWSVVKACLAAGLYPNLLRIDLNSSKWKKHQQKAKFFDRDHGYIKLHPASVNAYQSQQLWLHRWCVYSEKVLTDSALFAMDTTEVSPLPILLFGSGHPADGRILRLQNNNHTDEIDSIRAQLQLAKQEEAVLDLGTAREELRIRVDLLEARLAEALATTGPMKESLDDSSRFVVDLLESNGGSYPMARLSSFLKRARPQVRDEIGKIRAWVSTHGHLVECIKINNVWTIRLVDDSTRVPSHLADTDTEIRYGVEDWIYFADVDEHGTTAELVDRCKAGVRDVLRRQLGAKGGIGEAQKAFLDALCFALTENDAGEHVAVHQERRLD